MNILAFIPARGGSKSIPRKNIRKFSGHPLIAYSIEAARQSEYVTRIVCSTDDEEIAGMAENYGAEIPFLRPASLSGDKVTDFPVVEHCLQFFKEKGEQFDLIVHLRPTQPVRPPGIIDNAIRQIVDEPKADSLRSVSLPSENPFKMWTIQGNCLIPLIDSGKKEAYNMPRQDLPEVWWHNGIIDIVRSQCITDKKSISGDCIIPFQVPSEYAIDLDHEWQWLQAEARLKHFPLEYIKI